jgi:hypothetical protein
VSNNVAPIYCGQNSDFRLFTRPSVLDGSKIMLQAADREIFQGELSRIH